MKCKICNFEAKSNQQLVKHIRFNHDLLAQQYYDLYVKKEIEGSCIICGSRTNWKNIAEGYANTCSHSCGGKYFREQLRNNESQFASFKSLVTDNMKGIWAEREKTGEKFVIATKAGQTIKAQNSLLSKEELRGRYGWMNKLSPENKDRVVKEIVEKTFKKFRAEATEERKKEVQEKGLQTKIKKGQILPIELRDQYTVYRGRVRFLTEKVYLTHKGIINPKNLQRGRGIGFYVVDHKFSIFNGYKNDIDPEVMACVFNLQMLPFSSNSIKNSKSCITITELLENYYGKTT